MKNERPTCCHLLYYFTSYVLKMFRTLIYPSSRACDYVVELPYRSTDVVIQQHSRKLLMIDILMSETCWAHKKWNKIASDIKLVFHSSTKLYTICRTLPLISSSCSGFCFVGLRCVFFFSNFLKPKTRLFDIYSNWWLSYVVNKILLELWQTYKDTGANFRVTLKFEYSKILP